MKKTKTVLILEAGGPCGISCLKIISRLENVRMIAADMSQYASGLQLADTSIIIPPANHPDFLSSIETIITKYSVDLVIPCFEFGFHQLAHKKHPFITDFQSAIACKDKLEFYNKCLHLQLPHPKTDLLNKIFTPSFPLYIKPRFGVGSRDNYVIADAQKLLNLKTFLDDHCDLYIAQELLTGVHWNVDVLVYNNKFITAVPRKDLVQKSGNCITVEVESYQPLIEFSRLVQTKLQILSPFNLEVFEISPGKFVINEINVRFGGGIIFSALAGIDMVSYLIDQNPDRISSLKEGIYSRYYEEIPINLKIITQP
jgi:carbamoylphosphate synthase large subunit